MAHLLLFLGCLLLIAYGLLRYAVALRREEAKRSVHLLWVPGAVILYGASLTLLLWLT